MGVGFCWPHLFTYKTYLVQLRFSDNFVIAIHSLQLQFCYCHTFSMEEEIAGSAKIAPHYTVCDA